MEANSGENYVRRRSKLVQNHLSTLPKNKNGEYIVERIRPQPRLLQVLRDLPVCTRVGVRRDVVGIEDFYSMISGELIELNEFLDLSGMAAAAGYKLRARNMTTFGVKVLGKVLKQDVYTGDNLWGLPWAGLPSSLQVYGIRDIHFGYICYCVLAGIKIRNLFPEPEIVCKILRVQSREELSVGYWSE